MAPAAHSGKENDEMERDLRRASVTGAVERLTEVDRRAYRRRRGGLGVR